MDPTTNVGFAEILLPLAGVAEMSQCCRAPAALYADSIQFARGVILFFGFLLSEQANIINNCNEGRMVVHRYKEESGAQPTTLYSTHTGCTNILGFI